MATGNMGQVPVEKKKPTKKATKAKAKPEPEKVETAAAPEPEAAPETNGEKQVEELVSESPVEEATPAPAPTGVQEKIAQDRQELTQKMMSGKTEQPQLVSEKILFIDAPIFPDAYCPLCGQKLAGNSKTGFKMALYTHPFTPAIALGKPCVLKGKKLRAPTVRMEIVQE